MSPQQFFKKGIAHGDKVEVTLKGSAYMYQKPRTEKAVLFFRGFRILCGNCITNGYRDLVPVFVRPTKNDDTMGRRHYGTAENEIPTWWENIKSVKILEKHPYRDQYEFLRS